MADIYVGLIVLEIDGAEYEVTSFEPTLTTNRKVVKTMNSTGKPKGHAKGINDYEIDVTVAIPKTGEPNWETMIDAKLTTYAQDGGGPRETYTGCWLMSVGSKFGTDNEATRQLKLGALNYYKE